MDKLKAPRIAITGGDTLIGRELRDLLGALKPAPKVELLSGDATASKFAPGDEEAMVLAPANAESLAGASVVVMAGTPASSRRVLDLTAAASTPLIDLTTALEDQPDARLRSPFLKPAGQRVPRRVHIAAHPASAMLALFYSRFAGQWPVRQSVVEVFEPASEHGRAGLRELQTQTVNLLSFKPLPQDVFDIQLGFNLLPAYGTEAPLPLDRIEATIERHLATLLLDSFEPAAGLPAAAAPVAVPMPSLRLVQAPVFHGYSASVWVEFATRPALAELEAALACAQIEVRARDQEPPTNVGAAGDSGLTVGDIRTDRNNPRAFWFWLVADNVRLSAAAALTVLREYL